MVDDSLPLREQHYYAPGPQALGFLKSDAFIKGIRGPVGSGKSSVCVMDLFGNAMRQHVVDNTRRYRCVVIRNTYGELQSTTIKTFHSWFPPEMGRYVMGAPIIQHIKRPLEDGTILDAEFLFLALDRPDHIRKLLSLEVTDGWINEAREVPKAILDHLTVRVGRFPSMKDGGPVNPHVIMDTNPPDSDHWWPMLSDHATEESLEEIKALERELLAMDAMKPGDKLMEFFTQPAAEGLDGKLNPDAENLENLTPGYYIKAKVGKSQEWINVYVRNEYGFVMDGKAVWPEYRDNFHSRDLTYNPKLKLHIGMDFGLTPAAIFAQRSPMGGVRVLHELTATRLGAKNFAREVKKFISDKYGEIGTVAIGTITGDPAGSAGSQADEEMTVFKMLESEGVVAKPAHTNDFGIRREAVATPLGMMIDGEPALAIDKGCRALRKGMAGGYHYRRIKVSDERYEDKPYKNMSSHPCEALQYLMLGLGIGREVTLRPGQSKERANRPTTAGGYDPHQ